MPKIKEITEVKIWAIDWQKKQAPYLLQQDDYEEELQEFIQDVDEGTEREYSFAIGALRPNETLWLDKVLLIKPVDGKIILEYSLKSNNTTGHIAGRLCYEHAEV